MIIVLIIIIVWMLFLVDRDPTIELDETVEYMERLSKNKFAGRDCNHDENFDHYKKIKVVYKFNVLTIFCVSRYCIEAKRHAAPPHGFPAFLKMIRFFESVGLNDSLHWH